MFCTKSAKVSSFLKVIRTVIQSPIDFLGKLEIFADRLLIGHLVLWQNLNLSGAW